MSTPKNAKPAAKTEHDEMEARLGFIVLRLLNEQNVSAEEVIRKFGVNERTVRNDFLRLEQSPLPKELLERSRGRLTLNTSRIKDTYYGKQLTQHYEAKQDVARRAADCFGPATSIAASPGTTVAMTAACITDSGKTPTLVTNSLGVVDQVRTMPAQIALVGGDYYATIHALVGERTVRGYKDMPCRDGLVGVSRLLGDGRLAVHFDAEVPVLKALLDAVEDRVVLVADGHKLGGTDGPWFINTVPDLLSSGSRKRKVVLVTNRLDQWPDQFGDNARKALETLKRLKLKNFEVIEAPRGYAPQQTN